MRRTKAVWHGIRPLRGFFFVPQRLRTDHTGDLMQAFIKRRALSMNTPEHFPENYQLILKWQN